MAILPLDRRVIYALVDPRDGMVRYVGVTDKPSVRYKEHLRARGTSSKEEWVKQLKLASLLPIFVFLDSVRFEESEKEERSWIEHFQSLGQLHNGKSKK